MEFIKRCWAEISATALLSNLAEIKKSVGNNTDVICVVKANAYGHGDLETAALLENAGVRFFAVASMREALHLRKHGIKSEIILLGGYLDDCIAYAAKHDITLSLYDKESAVRLSEYATANNVRIKVHIKLNTGMSRIGFDCTEESECIKTISSINEILTYDGLDVVGAFTHFSESDELSGVEFTTLQYQRFMKVKNAISDIKLWHCANSGAIVNYPEFKLDMVRAGILLYGVYNSNGCDKNKFKPVLSLKTVITQIREIKKGDFVSYGRTFTAQNPMRLAILSIGYADGYPRTLSGCGKVIVNGQYADIVGRVCMDQTIIDVTDIECNVGDTVTVIGVEGDKSISADDIAKIDDTINYEILCRISPRVPRVYFKEGTQYKVKEYI